jgi:hypothetical protein
VRRSELVDPEGDGAIGAAHGDRPPVLAPHHHAVQDGLAAHPCHPESLTGAAVEGAAATPPLRRGGRRYPLAVAVYEYRCSTCDEAFEHRRSMLDAEVIVRCPQGRR